MSATMTLAFAAPTALPPIREAVFFGDSLTDAGTFWFRFTTNPGLIWAQHVALHFGQSPLPNQHVDSYADVFCDLPGLAGPHGLNYAQGGACAELPYAATCTSAEGTPISTAVQLRHFLAQHDTFKQDQIVFLYIGTNDVANNYDPKNNIELAQSMRANEAVPAQVMALERSRVRQAGAAAAKVATQILANGAKRLVVFKLARLGDMPWFRTEAAQEYVNELTALYNHSLVTSLPESTAILLLDVQDFLDGLVRNADAYGLKHFAHEDACREPDQDYCYPNGLKSRDADMTYIFAASQHMTTRANELLAEYVLTKIAGSSLR